MKVIFSAWNANSHYFIDKKIAYLSNKLIQQLGYKTTLYADEHFREYLKNIGYDEIIPLDQDVLNKFPRKAWSLGKILAMSMVKEPFIHLDFDLFVLKNLDKDFLQNPVFCLHSEPWMANSKSFNPVYYAFMDFVDPSLKNLLPKITPNKDSNDFNYLSQNFSIIGGQNFEIINKCAEEAVDFGIKHKDSINKFHEKYVTSKHWVCAVYLEQIYFAHLIKRSLSIPKIPTYLKDSYDLAHLSKDANSKFIVHLWGGKFVGSKSENLSSKNPWISKTANEMQIFLEILNARLHFVK